MTDVLVADDSPAILNLIVIALGREGIEPVTATNGEEALARIREHKPRVVILDAMMPLGDGYDVCRALRDDAAEVQPYVIMLTAGTRDADRERAAEAGVDEFMTKPFSPKELRARVVELLASP